MLLKYTAVLVLLLLTVISANRKYIELRVLSTNYLYSSIYNKPLWALQRLYNSNFQQLFILKKHKSVLFSYISRCCSPINIWQFRQCDNTLPDGTVCGPEDYVTQADPESCWQYYECSEGCVTHQTCQDDFKYDDRYNWCTFPYDVDCGSRPCNDPTHCPPPTTAATTTQDCSSTPPIDCEVTGDGYFADEYNCRKYWNCIKGSDPKHIMCPDADDGSGPMMFDLTYMGCNFASQTRCNGRPICDECNNNCQDTPTEPPPCIPDDQIIECENLGAGWHPDTYNCRFKHINVATKLRLRSIFNLRCNTETYFIHGWSLISESYSGVTGIVWSQMPSQSIWSATRTRTESSWCGTPPTMGATTPPTRTAETGPRVTTVTRAAGPPRPRILLIVDTI